MNAVKLKNYIIQNDKIKDILEDLQCHKIKENGNEIRCALPNHNNGTSVRIKTETLSVKAFDDEFTMQGDIYTFIMKLKNITFVESLKYLHNFLNLKYQNTYVKPTEPKVDLCSIFLQAKKTSQAKNHYTEEMSIFNTMSEEYVFLPHILWIRDGITPRACKKFHIGYDIKSKRILIPHKLWCGGEDDYVGLIGRTTIPNYDLLDIPKYCSMRKERYPKTMNLYGLQENYETIQEAGYVVVFEAEKSVLKRYSRYDGTGVALCCHEISFEQEKILASLDVEIIIAMDEGIDLFTIREMCEKFYRLRKVSYMYDTYGKILKSKESPADKENKLYEYMFRFRIQYDEHEHNEYIRELNKRKAKRKI